MPRTRQQTGAVATRTYAETDDEDLEVTDDDNDMIPYHPRKHEHEEVEADEPGFKLWTTTSRVTSGKDLEVASQWNTRARKFAQVVEVQHNEEFKLKPLVLTEGAFKGRHVLMLEPIEPTGYFRFLDLPPELRAMIYDLLLVNSKDSIRIDAYKPKGLIRRPVQAGYQYQSHCGAWDKATGKWSEQTPSNASMLRVNKQLFSETAPILYGRHAFKFDSMIAADVFLSAIGSMREYLRQLKLNITWRTTAYVEKRAPAIFSMLKDAQDLRSIVLSHELACRKSHRYNRWPGAERIVADSAALLWAVHKKKPGMDTRVAAVNLLQLSDKEKCWDCDHGYESDCRSVCGVKCDDLGQHQDQVRTKLRELVKAKLELIELKKK